MGCSSNFEKNKGQNLCKNNQNSENKKEEMPDEISHALPRDFTAIVTL